MRADAQASRKAVLVTMIPGADHFAALGPAVQKMTLRFNSE